MQCNGLIVVARCGSVTVYFSLEFAQSVAIPTVLSVLKNAAESKGFGEFEVGLGSIQAISDDQLPTDASTQGPPSKTEESSGTVRNFFVSPVCFFVTSYQA